VAEFIPPSSDCLIEQFQAFENEKSLAVPLNYKIRTSANDGVTDGRPRKNGTAKQTPFSSNP